MTHEEQIARLLRSGYKRDSYGCWYGPDGRFFQTTKAAFEYVALGQS